MRTARATGLPWTPATRRASSAAAVSFESGWPPTAQEKPPLLAWWASSQRGRLLRRVPEREHRPARRVERRADPAARRRRALQAVEQRGRVSAERLLGERDEGDVGRRRERRLLRLAGTRASPVAARAGGGEAEHGPRRERGVCRSTLLRERSAARVRLHELHGGDRRGPARPGTGATSIRPLCAAGCGSARASVATPVRSRAPARSSQPHGTGRTTAPGRARPRARPWCAGRTRTRARGP